MNQLLAEYPAKGRDLHNRGRRARIMVVVGVVNIVDPAANCSGKIGCRQG